MRSVDTNVLARYLLADDPKQTDVAQKLFEQRVHIPLSVLMETSWLLSSRYGLERSMIARMFSVLGETETVDIADDAHFGWLLGRFAAGADFPDLVHLIASRNHTSFATFDQALEKQAGNESPMRIETLS